MIFQAWMLSLLPRRMFQQLLLLTSTCLLLVIGLYSVYVFFERSASIQRNLETQATALARNLALSAQRPLIFGDLDVLAGLVKLATDFPEVSELRIIDSEGRVLSHYRQGGKEIFDPLSVRLALPQTIQVSIVDERLKGQHRLVVWYPVIGGNFLGWIRLDYSTARLDKLSYQILMTTVLAALLAILFSSLLLYYVLRRPMRALDAARQFSVKLEKSQGEQLPMMRAPVEIEDLIQALNLVSHNLHQQHLTLSRNYTALETKEAEIRDRTEQLHAIFSLSPDGFVTFDRQLCVKYASPAFFAMTGYEIASVIGTHATALSDRLLQDCGQNAHIAARQISQASSHSAELFALTNLGRRQLLEFTTFGQRVLALELRLAETGTVSQIAYFRDVTHEIEVDRMKSEFLSIAAHELRTPMTSILGFSEVLLNLDVSSAESKEYLKIIHDQSRWMTSIVNELLDLARIEARRGQDFNVEILTLPDLLMNTLRSYKHPDGRLAPQLRGRENLPAVYGDRGKLAQVITNLISNAYKYSPNGGEVSVEMFIENDQAMVGFTVIDQGIGMNQEQLSHLFERFYRADASGKIPGTGLGLSIAKEIIELHGGHIEATSEIGVGTRIAVWIPAVELAHSNEIKPAG